MFEIVIEHWNREEAERFSLASRDAAYTVYKTLVAVCLEEICDVETVRLINPTGDEISVCRF